MTGLHNGMRVAVVGQGAREHAMVWKLAQSAWKPVLYALPGNPGMEALATTVAIQVTDIEGIVSFAKEAAIELVVIGPEQPLALGLVDALKDAGILAFGPSRRAAELEASKGFAKQLMKEAGVPTARFEVFEDVASALAFARTLTPPLVIKADGLAAGKGVVIAASLEEAEATLHDMLEGNRFGASGHRVVIEEFLRGEEVSCMYFVDAHNAVPMLPARDFKRVGDGDTGPNTGGMGAFAPVPSVMAGGVIEQVTNNIVHPTLRQLRKAGVVYRGVLYVGLMMTDAGPSVIEFNARFGDPETEVVLPLLDSDFLTIVHAVATDTLTSDMVAWKREAAVCGVLAGAGYPARSDAGTPISIAADAMTEATVLFHAGTKRESGQLVTAGGRVFALTAVAEAIPAAIETLYRTVPNVEFEGMTFRRDIGHNWQR